MNLEAENFHNEIIKLINNSGLPIGLAYYILKDCLNELLIIYNKAIIKERESPSETITEEIPISEEKQVKQEEEKE